MTNPLRASLFTVTLCAALSGCAAGNYTRSVNGTKGGYSMNNVHPKPISLMVAKKVERPI